MKKFNIGQTIKCSLTIREDGVLTDPSTSTKIIVTDDTYASVVALTAMTNDSVGVYHYYFQTVGLPARVYYISAIADDGSLISINKVSCELV